MSRSNPAERKAIGALKLMRIVLIEDNPADVRLFREALLSSKIEAKLDHFPDGAAAVASIRVAAEPWTPLPDVVFLDLNMPCVDGFDVLAFLRSTPQYVDVPVAIFTSCASPVDKERALELGANRFVVKPATLRDFIDVVSSTIRELAAIQS
jgi:CheY-like chemotaxis protein